MTIWTWQHPAWPQFEVDESALCEQLAGAKAGLNDLASKAAWLPLNALESIHVEALCQEGVGTALIEGHLIDPGAIRSSIAKRLGLDTAGWSAPPREVDGLVSVLVDATESWNDPLTVEKLCGWQAAIFPTGRSGFDKITVGAFRVGPVNIISGGAMGHPTKVHYEAPPADMVEREVAAFLEWFNADTQLDGIIRAAIAHAWFEAIHPFEDGNGRIGRVIVDLALAQEEKTSQRLFSLSAELYKERKDYTDAIGLLNNPNPDQPLDLTRWVSFFLTQVEKATTTAQHVIHTSLQRSKFWSVWSHVDISDRQRKVLNKILSEGADGFPGGINNSKYRSIGQTSLPTATRDLADLAEKGVLLPSVKGGRSKSYSIDWISLQPALIGSHAKSSSPRRSA